MSERLPNRVSSDRKRWSAAGKDHARPRSRNRHGNERDALTTRRPGEPRRPSPALSRHRATATRTASSQRSTPAPGPNPHSAAASAPSTSRDFVPGRFSDVGQRSCTRACRRPRNLHRTCHAWAERLSTRAGEELPKCGRLSHHVRSWSMGCRSVTAPRSTFMSRSYLCAGAQHLCCKSAGRRADSNLCPQCGSSALSSRSWWRRDLGRR